jgi:hypothetical protein
MVMVWQGGKAASSLKSAARDRQAIAESLGTKIFLKIDALIKL